MQRRGDAAMKRETARVRERERETARAKEHERERERERDSACERACVSERQ